MYYYEIFMKIVEKYKNLNNNKRVSHNIRDGRVLENVVFRPDLPPKAHANYLNIELQKVEQIMQFFAVDSIEERTVLLEEANKYVDLIQQQLNREERNTIDDKIKIFMKDLSNRLRTKCGTDKGKRGFRLLSLIILCKRKNYRNIFPERQKWIMTLSANDAYNFFRDLRYEINKQEKGIDVNSISEIIKESVHEDNEHEERTTENSQDDKIQELEFKLQTTQSTLKFIQRSLDDMVANIEKKTQEAQDEAINNFFTSINSERYGRLLDNAVIIDHKNTKLRQQHFKFPIEVMGMPMIIKNFIAFIKSIGFEPIRTWGEQFEVTADDLLYDVYEGEPFLGDEKKLVQVIYPGWKRKDIILSKPVVKEVFLED